MPMTHRLTAAATLAGAALLLTLAVFTFPFFCSCLSRPRLAALLSAPARFTRLLRIVLCVDNTSGFNF
jgi:hypothetical protein